MTIATRVSPDGSVITNTDTSNIKPILADVVARKIPYQDIVVPALQVPGTFNEENARAAKAAAYAYDPELHEADIDQALASYTGTWRRFEYKGVTNHGAVVYDDYAHHPTAVQGTIRATHTLFPNKRIIVAFHPHLYSRTRDFLDAFATALAQADEVLLAPVYAAREEPIPGISSAVLAEKISALGTPARAFTSLEEIEEHLLSSASNLKPQTVLLTMGAGDIYRVADAITSHA
jgi:UDP-N-acetylmuramate--alanine ligase